MNFGLPSTAVLFAALAALVVVAQDEGLSQTPPRTTTEAAAAGIVAAEVKERTLGYLEWARDLVRMWKNSPVVLDNAKAKNALLKLNGKTAIVFGGTSGIGHSLAVRFAQAGSNVYIVGRSEKAAAAILEEMKGFNVADATYRFVASDLSLLRNARAAVKQLPEELKVVDYVVFCQTKATVQGRTPTVENIDEKLALNYFSRVELVRQLLPRLEAAEDARVMSVLSAGVHAPHADFKTDFAVENYSLKKAADAAGFYTDLAFDHLSRQHPKVTFIHAAPGFVSTNWGTDMPVALRLPIRALQATVAKASSDCAEFLFPSLTQPDQRGNGKVHLIGEYGQDAATTKLHTDEAVAFVWQETEKVISV
jgi:NAD(P)-dependent dehydrogenase (short-subunit alcohol dehydrogenase family)